MLGGACVWESFWSLQQPSLCLWGRGALGQLLRLQLLQVGAPTALLWPCSWHRGRAESSGDGEGRGRVGSRTAKP